MTITYQQYSLTGALKLLLERLPNPTPAGRDQWRACCPAHGTGRNRALSVRLEGGRVLLHCFGGCEPEAVLQALGFDSWADLHRGTGQPYAPPVRVDTPKTPDQGQRARLERLWQAAQPLRTGDPVSRYLEGRGLRLEIFPPSVRFHPALEYWHTPEGRDRPELLGTFPAMLARVEHPAHGLVALHRTYLTLEGRKADVPGPKKLTKPTLEGAVMGAAVRLCSSRDRLALAEGIETALAVRLASGWPVWACVSAGGLARVLLPSTLREVLISADHDRAGLEAAHTLALRLSGEGVRVRVATPPEPGADWLDVWQAEQRAVKHGG